MGKRFKWSGRTEFRGKINARAKATPIASAGAIFEEAVEIIGKAKRITPVDTGTLVNTGSALLPVIRGDEASVELGFGGPAAPYSVKVHEDLEAHHPTGQAKYLEQPMDEALVGMDERLAERIKRRTKE